MDEDKVDKDLIKQLDDGLNDVKEGRLMESSQTEDKVRAKGKPKSEEWKKGQSERMKLAHARRKALKENVTT